MEKRSEGRRHGAWNMQTKKKKHKDIMSTNPL
jgi:hypothetical protein